MSIQLDENRSPLSPPIQAVLEALRLRIRRYVWAEGIASGIAWLGCAFWVSLAADWFFEPPVPIRVFLLLAVGTVLLTIVVKLIVRRAFVPLSDDSMATVLERRFSELDDSLLTVVALSRRDPSHDAYFAAMFDRTRDEANRRIQNVRLNDVFNLLPLRRAALAASLLLIGIALFAIVAPQSLGIWSRRALGLSDELWPRLCKLKMPEGFPGGVRKVARGADVEIAVRAIPADTGIFVIPPEVEIRYREEGGARGRATMDKIGHADPAKDAFQEFSYTRRNVLTPIRFDIQGGDAALTNLRIDVVESPNIARWTLDCEYPAYLGRGKRSVPVTGVMPIPQGTRVRVRASANKPLERVQIDRISGDAKTGRPAVLSGKQLSADRRQFEYTIDSLDKDTALLVMLFDADGIKSREAIRLGLVALPDQPPQIAAQLDGIGTAITAKARIAVAGHATDDYGIGKIWFEHGVEQRPLAITSLGTATDKPAEALPERNLDGQALEVEKLDLKPGQKFQVSLKASDLCTLGEKPNIGTSERWILDVVTPEQLRALLEGRELVLRQRFESIMQEMTETRDLLARAYHGRTAADSTPSGKDRKITTETAKPTSKPNSEPDAPTSSEKKKSFGEEPGDEPGDSPTAGASASPERLIARIQSASTNCQKSTQETVGLADSFEDIRKQLVNNRIDTAELKERLQSGIAEPLKNIAGEMLPELDRRLESLHISLEEAKNRPELWDLAQSQADAVLLAMQKVLDRMLELEDYNQMVEMLRDLIKMQEQLRTQTEQRQKQKIRDLLKE